MNKIIVHLVALLLLNLNCFAQEVEMADKFRAEGKIYVVLAVVFLILIATFILLYRLEIQLKKLEKEKS